MIVEQKITQDKLTDFQSTAYERAGDAGLPKLHLDMILMETTGGPCTLCGKLWRKIPVKNTCADFTYYDPACDCFGRCSACHTSWHREVSAGTNAAEIRLCTSCGWVKYPQYGRICLKCGEGFITDFKDSYWTKCPGCQGKRRGKREDAY